MIRRVIWCWVDVLDWLVDRLDAVVRVTSDWADDPLWEDERAS